MTEEKYTCPKCGRSEPEVHETKATANMCNQCTTKTDQHYESIRIADGDIAWDIDLGFEWLYNITKGYSVKAINEVRELNNKPVFKCKGCYLWGDE
jgi:hypothetical protein